MVRMSGGRALAAMVTMSRCLSMTSRVAGIMRATVMLLVVRHD
jgi:hypothetical protein